MGQGDVLELGPQLQAVRVAGLQLDHQAAGAVGEGFGLVEALLGGAVEVLQVRQLVTGDGVFFQVGHQHAELGAPVAHVVLADHGVAEELQDPGHAVANDGGAQVANVHFLGQVGRRHVDHGALRRAGLAYAQVGVAKSGVQARGQGLGVLEEVDEAGAGDFRLAQVFMGRQGGDDFLRQVARLHAGRLGQHHGDVAGEVAVGLVAGVFDLDRRRQAFWQHTFGDELGDGLLDELANGVFHGLLFRPLVRRRFGAQVEKLGIIRCWNGLANYRGLLGDRWRHSIAFAGKPALAGLMLPIVGAGLPAKARPRSIQIHGIHIQRPADLPPAGHLFQHQQPTAEQTMQGRSGIGLQQQLRAITSGAPLHRSRHRAQ